ncbi:MAG: tyrosine-type recombinase/integrase, partial [Actinobacteria bacterium]|nr:tyrosine-type recombinase/integrase [Actinomycetota bacterium]
TAGGADHPGRQVSSLARLPHAPSVGLGAAVEAFLVDRDLAVSTRRVYELTLAALAKDLGADVEVASIGRDDLRAFLHARHHTAAAKTWNRVVATLGSFFAYCSRHGWVAASPAAALERRRERADRVQVARTRAIPLEELEGFLGAPRHALRERPLWRMLYETAARAQEILLLDVGDLDVPNKRAMVIGKGGNAEPIGWETATARLLPRYLAGRNAGPLFLSSLAPAPSRQPAAADAEPGTGRARLSYRRAAEVFRTASGGWTLHQLRHSRLTHLAEAGVAGPLLMAKSRHGSVKTLNLYAKPTFDAVAEVTARLDPVRRRGAPH